MLEVQKYLRKYGEEELTSKYAIKVKSHPAYPELKLFAYDQINSPRSPEIVKECRGLILDSGDNYKVVYYPFKRFFNYGEQEADEIDWDSANYTLKMDGSLMTLAFNPYSDEWAVSTKGSPDAGGSVGDWNFTFKELFWKTWYEMDLSLPVDGNKGLYCYLFELTSPFNRIVVKYDKPSLTLLGVRNLSTLKEVDPVWVGLGNDWPVVKSYSFSNSKELLEYCEKTKGYEEEGFVVVDKNFNRQKFKSRDYVRLHRMVGDFSQKKMIDVIRNNEEYEFLSYFPEYKEEYDTLIAKFEGLVERVEKTYLSLSCLETQKDFAIEAKKHRFSDALFSMRNGKVNSIKDYYRFKNLDKLTDEIMSFQEDMDER